MYYNDVLVLALRAHLESGFISTSPSLLIWVGRNAMRVGKFDSRKILSNFSLDIDKNNN